LQRQLLSVGIVYSIPGATIRGGSSWRRVETELEGRLINHPHFVESSRIDLLVLSLSS
jgi:hypothetical protein